MVFKSQALKSWVNLPILWYKYILANLPQGVVMSDTTRSYWIIQWTKKLRFIKDKGSKCCECGMDLYKEPWKATFHHLDPSIKEFAPNTLTKINYDEAVLELNKCILLCHNCHSCKHYNKEVWDKFEEKVRVGVDTIHEKSTKRFPFNEQKLIEYHTRGLSVAKISKKMQRSRETIVTHLKKLNLPIINDMRKFTQDTPDVILKIREYRSQGLSCQRIADIFKCTKQAIIWHRKRHNIP